MGNTREPYSKKKKITYRETNNKETTETRRKEAESKKHKTISNKGLNVSFRMEIEFYHLFAI